MSVAYRSTRRPLARHAAGLLVRQTHHWAALVFIVAIVLHMLRVFFTGAFRKPRDLNWYLGLTMLALALLEGFTGYSLPDDLLSGMGLAIAYSRRRSRSRGSAPTSRSGSGTAPFPGSRRDRAAAVHRCTS